MDFERHSILGNTVVGYKMVETSISSKAAEQSKMPDVPSDTPTSDVARILLRRLEDESNRIAARQNRLPNGRGSTK